MIGGLRRFQGGDLVAYKQSEAWGSNAAMDELIRESDRLDLGVLSDPGKVKVVMKIVRI